ncbi:D-alanyl-D-alanine carboxypeptidase [Actinomadura gamaensis]|uniref:Peptidase S11 D-alanyl-D-alanine carboxypeptidase A N-terminal domain-containing protein n=1 Tax=Actinomadura gamaensis TaxID=1763541 RepID=A0ABV9U3V4_9ACTN
MTDDAQNRPDDTEPARSETIEFAVPAHPARDSEDAGTEDAADREGDSEESGAHPVQASRSSGQWTVSAPERAEPFRSASPTVEDKLPAVPSANQNAPAEDAPRTSGPHPTTPHTSGSHPSHPDTSQQDAAAPQPSEPQQDTQRESAQHRAAPEPSGPQQDAPRVSQHRAEPQASVSQKDAPNASGQHRATPQRSAPQQNTQRASEQHRAAPQAEGAQQDAPRGSGQHRAAPEPSAPQQNAQRASGQHRAAAQAGEAQQDAPRGSGQHRAAPEPSGPQQNTPRISAQPLAAPQPSEPQQDAPSASGQHRAAPQAGAPQQDAQRVSRHRAEPPASGSQQDISSASGQHRATPQAGGAQQGAQGGGSGQHRAGPPAGGAPQWDASRASGQQPVYQAGGPQQGAPRDSGQYRANPQASGQHQAAPQVGGTQQGAPQAGGQQWAGTAPPVERAIVPRFSAQAQAEARAQAQAQAWDGDATRMDAPLNPSQLPVGVQPRAGGPHAAAGPGAVGPQAAGPRATGPRATGPRADGPSYEEEPKRGRRGLVIGLVAVLVLVAGVVAGQLVRPVPEPSLELAMGSSSHTFGGQKPVLPWPKAGQATVYVDGLGTMGSSGASTPTPTASVAKVMTAYVILRDKALRSGENGPTFTVTPQGASEVAGRKARGESLLGITPNQQFTERKALEALLIISANDVAHELARWDAGSDQAFVVKMNEAARSLGMTSTTYTDPSGYDSATVSTAADQVKLLRAAMRLPGFAESVAQRQFVPDGGGKPRNAGNILLGQYGVVGGKTGYTDKAGGNFVFAARKQVGGVETLILGAVMNQPSPSAIGAINAAQPLVAAAENALVAATVAPSGSRVARVDDGLGGGAPLRAAKPVTVVGWPGLTVPFGVAGAPPGTAPQNAKVGTLTAGATRVPLSLDRPLSKPSLLDRLTRLG